MPKRKPDPVDDGATEVVETSPLRRKPPIADLKDAAARRSGGRLTEMRAAGVAVRQDFLRLRTPLASVQVSIPHLPMFDALWKLWSEKRAAGEANPGVSKAEITEYTGLDPKKVQHIFNTFKRTGMARSVVQHIGWRGTRALYYPTDQGIFAFSLAEVLGHGSSVQVGYSQKAWRARNQTEPQSIFQLAAVIRGDPTPKSLAD